MLLPLRFSKDRMWCIHFTGFPVVNRVTYTFMLRYFIVYRRIQLTCSPATQLRSWEVQLFCLYIISSNQLHDCNPPNESTCDLNWMATSMKTRSPNPSMIGVEKQPATVMNSFSRIHSSNRSYNLLNATNSRNLLPVG